MVRNKKLVTLSLLMSLFITPFLSAMELEDMVAQGSQMEIEKFSELDLDGCTMLFDPAHVRTEGLEKKVQLGADKNGFFVQDGEETIRVHAYDTDEEFKGRSLNEIALYGMTSKFKVSQFDNGEYKVAAAEGLNGGGLFGAWLGSCLGTGLVVFTGEVVIGAISLCTGAAAPATFTALNAAFGPTLIAPAAKVAAVAGGIAGGVATGPV